MEENTKTALTVLAYALRFSRHGKDIAYNEVSGDGKRAAIHFHFEDRRQIVNIDGDSALAAIIDVCNALK